MREVEPLADLVEHAPADELLHRRRRLALVERRRPLEHVELELTADHGGDRRQLAGALPEPAEAARDDLAHALGQGHGRRRGDPALVKGPDRLDDDERIAVAHGPGVLGHL